MQHQKFFNRKLFLEKEGKYLTKRLCRYDDPEKLNAEELKKFNNEMNENINETRKNFILESQKSKENDPTYKVVERFDD